MRREVGVADKVDSCQLLLEMRPRWRKLTARSHPKSNGPKGAPCGAKTEIDSKLTAVNFTRNRSRRAKLEIYVLRSNRVKDHTPQPFVHGRRIGSCRPDQRQIKSASERAVAEDQPLRDPLAKTAGDRGHEI